MRNRAVEDKNGYGGGMVKISSPTLLQESECYSKRDRIDSIRMFFFRSLSTARCRASSRWHILTCKFRVLHHRYQGLQVVHFKLERRIISPSPSSISSQRSIIIFSTSSDAAILLVGIFDDTFELWYDVFALELVHVFPLSICPPPSTKIVTFSLRAPLFIFTIGCILSELERRR